jgi:hypothetical protein
LKLTESMIVWNPGTDEIDVVPWPDETGLSDDYLMSVGACFTDLHRMNRHQQCAMLFIHFNSAVVGGRVPVEAAHRAFLKIDEYRLLIPLDFPGAEDGDSPLRSLP